jgi:FkbM family methyltransferase
MLAYIRSFLFRKPIETLSPNLDICILVPMRITYLTLKLLMRSLFGSQPTLGISYMSEFFSPSYHVARISNNILRKLRVIKGSLLVKVTVPKHGYSYYCKVIDFAPGREEQIIQNFKPIEGDTVIDVGANVGRYTILSSKIVGSRGRVIAIEPDPNTFHLLKKNIEVNKCTNVTAINCAAYSEDLESLRLFCPSRDCGTSIYNTVMEERTSTEKFINVPAAKLDSIVRQEFALCEHKINWIKIDVEGAELEVLKGAEMILSKSKDISVLIEVHNLRDGNFYSEIIDMLTNNNFRMSFEKVHAVGERHIIMHKLISNELKMP